MATPKKDPKDYDKFGRPTVVTEMVLQKLEEAFSIGCSDKEACVYANISERTLYYYQDSNPDFLQRKQLLKEKVVLLARQTVAKAIQNGDEKSAQWLLERKKRKEFAVRTQMELKQVEAFDDMTDEQLAEIVNGASEAIGDDAE